MTRRRLLAACLTLAAAALPASARSDNARSRGGGGGRTPHYRAPSMPVYRGRILRVPHGGNSGVQQRRPGPVRSGYAAPGVQRQPPQAAQRQGWTFHPAQNHGQTFHQGQTFHPAARSGGSAFRPPDRDQQGHPLNARPILDVTHRTELVHQSVADPGFGRTAQSLTQSAAERDGRFHWYDRHGVRFSHWHDQEHGRDWFGIYQGQTYFWTTLYRGHFWWREPVSGRWLAFWQDHWWWHSPQGSPYVYVDDQFYQWLPDQNGVALVQDPLPAEPDAKPEGDEGLVVSSRPEFNYSADGTRMVQVEGEKLSAYLYDANPKDKDAGNQLIKYLGDGVTAVSFTDTSKGDPLHIVLSIQDAGGAVRTVVLDANGEPIGPSEAAAPATAPIPFGTQGTPGYDAPEAGLPPTDAPFPDGE